MIKLKNPFDVGVKQVLMLVISLVLVIPAFSELPKGKDRLKPVLENYKRQEVFFNWEGSLGEKAAIDVKVASGKILVVYALVNQSTGYRWKVKAYDEKMLDIPEIKHEDACEPCPAPGASVYQRIAMVPAGAGFSQVELVYERLWEGVKTRAGRKILNVTTKGAFKGQFEYTPSPASMKKVAKADYEVKALPSYFDWRDQNIVTPIKDQGSCGSCWAFGATAGFEAKIKKKDGVERDLSEQYAVSCNEWGMSCAGGWWVHDIWWNVIPPGEKGAGAVYEEDFPYEAMDLECNPPHDHYEQLEGWAYTDDVEDNRWPTKLHDPTTAQVKEKLYEWGPIPTALCTDDWGGYTGGIMSGSTCDVTTHIVLITGWDDANQCFIIKNSWGQDWGEEGYCRINYSSHLVGQYSTYLKYDKTNPRIVMQGEQFYEGLDNDGSIRMPIQFRLFDAGNFAVTIGEMTEGVHYSIANLPSGLSAKVEAIESNKAKITLEGKATSHVDADDVQITLNFTNAAFADHSANEVENSSISLDIDFFDPYQIVYEDIEDKTCTTSDVWQFFELQNGQSYGLWYSYYEYENQPGTMTFFLETYTKRAICTTPGTDDIVNDRRLRAMNYGDLIDGLVDYMVTGGSYGEQHKITCAAYPDWNGRTAYVGIQFSQYGGTCYGWLRLQVNSGGSSVTLLDYAYNEEPFAPIRAGYTSEVTVTPVADFSPEVDESYTGVEVQFFDESSRVPDAWSWSFPGGTPSSSSERNPKVSYSGPGTYNATLTVSNSAGSDTKTINNVITIFNAAPPVADFKAAATVVPQGATVTFEDLSTNRPTLWDWNFEGGDPATSPDPKTKSTFASKGTFNISLNVENPFGSDNVTKSIQVVDPPAGGYCSATSTNFESLCITNVKLANLDHSSGNTEGGYEDHTSQFAAVDKDGQYTVEVGLNNGHWELNALGIWIDWNQDKDFDDAGETIHTMNGTQDYDKVFTVPTSAVSGMTVMRIRTHYSKDPFACGVDTYMGETEDYTIIVSGGGTVDTEPPSTPTNLSASNITENSVSLNWTASTDNVGVVGYDIYNGSAVLSSASTNNHELTGLTPNTTYNLSVKARDAAGNNSGSSNSVSVTTLPSTCSYCSAAGNDQSYEWITGVQIGSFSKSSAKENGGYSDFTTDVINLTAGSSTNVILTPNTTQYTEHFKVWIDYNGDCDFEDSGEEVLSGSAQGNTTGSINVPLTASGTTRLRVAMRYNSAPTSSCGNYDYGEVEDYTVKFDEGGEDTEPPSAPSNLSSTSTTDTSIGLSWTASTDNIGVTEYNIYRGSSLAGTTSSTNFTVTGLVCETSYSFYVTAEDAAGNVSSNSNILNAYTSTCSDSEPPSAPTNLAASSVTENSVYLSWTASTDNVGVTEYEVLNGSSIAATVTGTSISVSGLSASTTYTFTVRAKDAAGNISSASNAVTITTEGVPVTYCDASGTNGPEYCARVQLGSIDHSTGRTTYSNFTNLSTSMAAGTSQSITVSIGDIYSGDKVSCWVDWNIDGDFADSGEKFALSVSGSTATGTISAPSSATVGSTRLRVRVFYYSAGDNPCNSQTYGEVEDYTINVTSSAKSQPVATVSLINVYPNPNDGVFNVIITSEIKGEIVMNLLNSNGQLILSRTVIKDDKKLKLEINENLISGVYTVQFIFGNQSISKQVIVR